MLAALAMGAQEWSVLEDMSVSQLSGMLQERGVRCVGCLEKEDFLAKLRELELEDDMAPAMQAAPRGLVMRHRPGGPRPHGALTECGR